MSSGSSGRYQSRLFNFLNRQALRLTDQYDRTVRHLKVAATWGVQILLYPVYLLAQASLSVGRQLSSAAEAGWPRLKALTRSRPQEPPPAADIPIQRVLNQVNTLELQIERFNVGRLTVESSAQSPNLGFEHTYGEQLCNIEPSTSSTLPLGNTYDEQLATPTQLSQTAQESSNERYMIQGVASLLATRTLVLVTVENQILDILTAQQQRKLSSKISWEVANLRRQWRIAQTSNRQFTQRSLTTLDKPPVFLPMRLFWQLMAWVQTSPVAISANLFQESTLVSRCVSPNQTLALTYRSRRQRELPMSNDQTKINQQVPQSVIRYAPIPEAIAFLDRTVAELESNQLVPGSEVVIALGERTQKLLQPLQSKFMTPRHQAESPEVSQTNTFRIQALIYAAIDYFFGKHRRNLSQTDFQERSAILTNPQGQVQGLSGYHSNALPPNLELADATEPDPWLTWSDLYGTPDTQGLTHNPPSTIHTRKSQVQLPAAFKGKMPAMPGNSIWNVIKRYLGGKQPPGKLSRSRTVESRGKPPESVVPNTQLTTQGGPRGTVTTTLKNPSKQRDNAPTKRKTLSLAADARNTTISPPMAATTAITTPSSSSSDAHLEPAPDWIETQATPTGYVKHPLEQLLQWLDRGMLWLEELAMKIWRWLRHRRHRD
ncbi:MAG TPA: hypothetical protein V6D14_19455 [Coleofasciculaceae cyanobacterium]|jgi:hypothetical protein